MKSYTVAWITFNAFLDTDMYIIKQLLSSYKINWYIIRSGNDKFEYLNELEELHDPSLNIELLECGERLRSPECIKFYYKLLKAIRNDCNDLIYTSMAGAPYFIPILGYMANKKKVIMAIHNVHVPKGGSSYWFFKLYNELTIKIFQNFHTFSKSQYEYLRKIVGKKTVRYIPFILKDYGIATRQRNDSRISFLNFGYMRPYKRIDVLIRAAQTAYEQTKIEFRVILAGKCDDWEKFQRLIKYPNLFDLRLGRVDNSEIPNLFQECDYFVAPYQDIAQSGSSIVAINYEKPIIASRLPAFEEYIVDKVNGYLIRPANEKDLTDTIIEILKNHDTYYPTMKKNVHNIKELHFSTEAITKKYEEYFNDIIKAI